MRATGGEGGASHEMRDGVIHGGAKGGWKGLEARGGEPACKRSKS